MSLLVIAVVKDTAARAFGRPFFVPSIAVAMRGLADEINRPDSDQDIARHPEDFELYSLGDFDDQTGLIAALNEPMLAVRAKDLKKPL